MTSPQRPQRFDPEAERWKEIALYFADCMAATAEVLLDRKGTSKNERRRQLDLCEMALAAINAGGLVGKRPSQENWVRGRLAGIVAARALSPEERPR
jgi:hypothetical protein